MLCFKLLEFAEERVVLTVGEDRRIQDVVLARCPIKDFP